MEGWELTRACRITERCNQLVAYPFISLAPLKPIFTSIAFVPAFKTALNLLSWHVTGVIASESLPDHFLPPSLFRRLLVTFSSLSSRSLSRTGKENEQLACQARQRHILVVRRNGRGFLYFDSSALFMFPSPPPRCSCGVGRRGRGVNSSLVVCYECSNVNVQRSRGTL
ncbi:hypothetical protein F5878DRAFT_114510 [Lentinula raphanica]|uniref:Uncharacterized protein n=1 Tax=Lentinula raphanica TaxID=153919 RepID=A0AA38PBB3_9AGAR|nr:hypothetical protein F5878DRAFT_114510 [Lentinula raphanica]